MTDTIRPPATLNGSDIKPLSIPSAPSVASYSPFSASHTDAATQEDDGQISCFCGINEDDGNTVACDSCNRWQHIRCYYPAHADGELPEALQHYCLDCRPRGPNNADLAYPRQKEVKGQREVLQNGIKRSAAKSHKKKVKDSANSALPNGWPLDKHRHDRNSASPRDQGPPPKRPKTSHRSSNSTSNALSTQQSRKRSASTMHHRSVSRSPDSPVLSYSEEFIQAYRNDDYAIPDANCLSSLAISGKLSTWLCNPDEVHRITNGMELQDIFQRWDGDISAIDPQAELIEIREAHDPQVRTPEGIHPRWKYATVKEPLAPQACIGELRGHVGLKEEYQADPANRWDTLRHPEPFVFYHPHLPICIDARHEGTVVRYVRRSCSPNAELKIIITGAADYHFCFIATRDIEAGEEVAIAWDGGRGLADILSARSSNAFSRNDMASISQWVSTVLSNCGPCACQRSECLMARFDRRGMQPEIDEVLQPMKASKAAGRKKRAGNQIAPLNTQAVHSRSGSEVRKIEPDDEPTDSRSASGSAGRDSASRDMTPNTHYSTNGSLSTMPELSERERRKLAKEEEMFRRQEEEATGKQSKRKRTSGGSALNTPSVSTSQQLGFPSAPRNPDPSTSKHSSLSSSKSSGWKSSKTVVSRSHINPMSQPAKRPKPTYVDAATQCDLEKEDVTRHALAPRVRRSYVSLTQRLLERCARNNALQTSCGIRVQDLTIDGSKTDFVPTSANALSAASLPSKRPTGHPKDGAIPTVSEKTLPENREELMAIDSSLITSMWPTEGTASSLPMPSNLSHTSQSPVNTIVQPPMEPPPPPWTSKVRTPSSEEINSSPRPQKPQGMHLEMPAPVANPFMAHTQPLTSGTPGSVAGPIIQSPSSLTGSAALLSPSVQAAVTPITPARKKLSLSDYTRRNKVKESEAKVERDSSPTSTASGPVTGSLQSENRAQESLPPVQEEVKLEDATGQANSAL